MDVVRVAKAISYLRKRAGFTQKDLAERLGVSDKAVSKWERGLGLPDVSLLGKLSILLDTDTDSLLAGDVIHHDKGWHGLLIFNENECGIGPATIIYDKPLVYYLLGYFMLVGIKSIKIICSEHAERDILTVLTDSKQLNIDITFGRKIFHAINDAEFMYCDNLMVLFGCSFIYGVDMTRFLQKAMANRDRLTVLALPKGAKDPSSVIRFDANKKIVPLDHNDQLKTQYNYCDIPMFFCPKALLGRVYQPHFDDYDVSWVFQNQDVYIEALDRGFLEIRIDTWDDVAEASSFVRIIQAHCGMVLYCIEEIAWRRGYISYQKLQEIGGALGNTPYARYIKQLR